MINGSEKIVTWVVAIVIVISLWMIAYSAWGQSHPEAEINRLVKEHKRSHYIDFDLAVCLIAIEDDGRWTLHCEYRGEGEILKKFECRDCPKPLPCRACKKVKKKLIECRQKLKNCMKPERDTQIRKPQKKDRGYVPTKPDYHSDDPNPFDAGDRSPGRNGNTN